MSPFIAFFAVIGGLLIGAFAIWNDYQLKQKKLELDITKARDAAGVPADTDEIRGILKELLKHQARLTERVQNLEAIVTSTVYDERTRPRAAAPASAPATDTALTDEEQAAALARQIQQQERA